MIEYIVPDKTLRHCKFGWFDTWDRLVNTVISVAGQPDIEQESGYYGIDLHVHTLFSHCSISQPMDLMLRAHKIGLKGLAIMDHNNTDGAKDALVCAEYLKENNLLPEDFIVVPGQEINTSGGHLGVLFSMNEYPIGEPPEVTAARVRDDGGLVIVVHPFHSSGIGEHLLSTPADAVEVECGAVFNTKMADRTHNYLIENNLQGLAQLGSSDSHYRNAIGMCYTLVEGEKPSLESLREAIIAGKTKPKSTKAHKRLIKMLGRVTKLK